MISLGYLAVADISANPPHPVGCPGDHCDNPTSPRRHPSQSVPCVLRGLVGIGVSEMHAANSAQSQRRAERVA
jgi:hypothetical protein